MEDIYRKIVELYYNFIIKKQKWKAFDENSGFRGEKSIDEYAGNKILTSGEEIHLSDIYSIEAVVCNFIDQSEYTTIFCSNLICDKI